MVKFELVKESRNINRKDAKVIKPGCVCEHLGDHFDEVLKSFDNKSDALEELKKYQSSITEYGSLYEVEEFYVEENEYDDEEPDEWISGGDIWEFSEMKIRIVDERLNTLATVNNMADALRIQDEYIGREIDAIIMFN